MSYLAALVPAFLAVLVYAVAPLPYHWRRRKWRDYLQPGAVWEVVALSERHRLQVTILSISEHHHVRILRHRADCGQSMPLWVFLADYRPVMKGNTR